MSSDEEMFFPNVRPFTYGDSKSIRILIPSMGAWMSLAVPGRPLEDAVGSLVFAGVGAGGGALGMMIPFYLDDKDCFNSPPEILTEELNQREVDELALAAMSLVMNYFKRPELCHPTFMTAAYLPQMAEMISIKISEGRGHRAKDYILRKDMIIRYFSSHYPGTIDPRQGEVLGELHKRLSELPEDESA